MNRNFMDATEILKCLPHRYPFLLIDRVVEIREGEFLAALKNVSINEPFFTGHFPERPIMPGVLILEALAQAGGILAYKTDEKNNAGNPPDPGHLHYFAGIDNARFKRVVEPGDQLRLEVKFIRMKQAIWKFEGIATVEGQVVCTTEMMSAKRKIES